MDRAVQIDRDEMLEILYSVIQKLRAPVGARAVYQDIDASVCPDRSLYGSEARSPVRYIQNDWRNTHAILGQARLRFFQLSFVSCRQTDGRSATREGLRTSESYSAVGARDEGVVTHFQISWLCHNAESGSDAF
jgi:hypothetical protein